MRFALIGLVVVGTGCGGVREPNAPAAERGGATGPVIDMHLHAYPIDLFGPPPVRMCAPVDRFSAIDPRKPMRLAVEGDNAVLSCRATIVSPATSDELRTRTLEAMQRAGVVLAVTSGPMVSSWRSADRERILPGLALPLQQTSPEQLRSAAQRGDLAVMAEIGSQYGGLAPDDPALDPYFALAEELDLPVGVHMGPGPPGAGYQGSKYRAELSDPFRLEGVLLRHPKLRIYVMHAAWPLGDAMIGMLYAHPQLHVDVGLIAFALPRPTFHDYLRRLVDAGLVDRVLFGSDQMVWPDALTESIAAIRTADFLSPEQKDAILYANAARFLRIGPEEQRRHRALAAARSVAVAASR